MSNFSFQYYYCEEIIMDDVVINDGDFVELDYTASIASSGKVFDTTLADAAKREGIYNKEARYNPLVICAGKGQLVKGLDEFIIGKKQGHFKVELPAEKAFGKKDAKLLRLVSISEFHHHKIDPVPGLEVELDGQRGIVRTINGGRVIVDFNHPLSSQDINYDLVIKSIVLDDKVKIEGLLNFYGIPFKAVGLADGKATIEFESGMPEEIKKPLSDEIANLTGVKDITFK